MNHTLLKGSARCCRIAEYLFFRRGPSTKTFNPINGLFSFISEDDSYHEDCFFPRMPWNDMELKASRKDVAGPKNPKNSKKNLFFFLEFRGMPRHHGKNSIATDRQGKWVKIYFSENVLGRKNFVPISGLLSFISEDDSNHEDCFFHECHGMIWS